MFLPKESLYLIPFYDLRRLRDLTIQDRKIIQLKTKCFKEYKEPIRQWRRSLK